MSAVADNSSSSSLGFFEVVGEVLNQTGTELFMFCLTVFFAWLIRHFGQFGTPKHVEVIPKKCLPVPETKKQRHMASPQREALSSTDRRGSLQSSVQVPLHYTLDYLATAARDLQGKQASKVCADVLRQYYDFVAVLAQKQVCISEVAYQARHNAVDLYSSMIYCVIRASRFNLVESLLDDMKRQGVVRPLHLYESTMKQLAGAKKYKLALGIYAKLIEDGLEPSTITVSCAINFAVEVGELHRAIELFRCLSAVSTPSIRAYMTMLRVHSMRQDWTASLKTIREMQLKGVVVDTLILNMALSTGVLENKVEDMEALILEAAVADIISYNILAKGYAQRSDGDRALALLEKLRTQGLKPNTITFNTIMAAVVRGGLLEKAWNLLGQMHNEGIRPDKATCSTLIKSLSRKPLESAGVADCLQLLDKVSESCDRSCLATLYHAIFDAACKAPDDASDGLVEKVLSAMSELGITPPASSNTFIVKAIAGAMREEAW